MAYSLAGFRIGVGGSQTVTGTFTPVKIIPTVLASAVQNNSTQTLYTVPAGKKATIMGVSLATSMGSLAVLRTGSIQANGVALLQIIHEGGATTPGVSNTQALSFDYNNGPMIAAGQTITVVSSGGSLNVVGTVMYYEEAV